MGGIYYSIIAIGSIALFALSIVAFVWGIILLIRIAYWNKKGIRIPNWGFWKYIEPMTLGGAIGIIVFGLLSILLFPALLLVH